MDLLNDIIHVHGPKAIGALCPYWHLIAMGVAAVVVLKVLLSTFLSSSRRAIPRFNFAIHC